MSDELSYDIFSQAVNAVRGNGNRRVLGNLIPKVLIASGHSDSSESLTIYYNSIQPVVGILDGFMLRGGGGRVRTDIESKVIKINTETDLILLGMVGYRQTDSDRMVTWEIAGSSHVDQKFMDNMAATIRRDFGPYEFPECDQPAFSLIPFNYAFSAALDHLVRWIGKNVPSPPGIPVTIAQTEPVVVIARDSLGNALGGIRLPPHAVPVALNTGNNSGAGFCKYSGSHAYFDQTLLKALYPHHQDYMTAFTISVLDNLQAGYLLDPDTSGMLEQARKLSALWE